MCIFGSAMTPKGKIYWEVNARLFGSHVGCALVFASEAKIEIEAKIFFRLEANSKILKRK